MPELHLWQSIKSVQFHKYDNGTQPNVLPRRCVKFTDCYRSLQIVQYNALMPS